MYDKIRLSERLIKRCFNTERGAISVKQVFNMQDLECANCAAKMEAAIAKLEGVESVRVNFMTQKLTISASDHLFDSIMNQAQKIIRKIEPDCSVLL